ncbi:MAG TPA: hypothetical protein VFN61_13285 [Acidimicrobiales bacterium]|nr:hypothetical protein [Acidimicrobiales bacterium]
MGDKPNGRVFLRDARGQGRYMRVTWHPDSATVVFSHWQGDVCMASTRVPIVPASRLVRLLVSALADVATRPSLPVGEPTPVLTGGPPSHTRWQLRLRKRLRPAMAQLLRIHPDGAEQQRRAG